MKIFAFLATLALYSTAFAYEVQIKKGQLRPDLETMMEKARLDTGVNYQINDFKLIEDRKLATSRFQLFVQVNQEIPVAKTAIRIWSHLNTQELILAEMHLDEKTKKNEGFLFLKYKRAKFSKTSLKSKELSAAVSDHVTRVVYGHRMDNRVLGMKFKDEWLNGELVRQVEVRGRRGTHFITISLFQNKVIEKTYIEFPQSEGVQTLKANIFPMYEEVESSGEKLPFEVKELKYLNVNRRDAGENPLGALSTESFPEHRYHPLLAETEYEQAMNLWSEASIRRKVEAIVKGLPLLTNNFASGFLLEGRYATINLHPAVKDAFKDIDFQLHPSVNHLLSWKKTAEGWEAHPISGFQGRGVLSQEELLARIPERLANHNPLAYINSGFDEAQVYYGVTALMESLTQMGFTDPELSTKPFHAFLFDPDIGMQDNAYYTDNTINFTTYSAKSPNLARDNPTIWHELGHGVMDRLMGPHLGFSDSKGGYGGLSEGMADFVAKLVVEDQTSGADFPGKFDFRIMNQTGFYLTNELHDEGEAYGGAMNDMLASALSLRGKKGLHAFTDLTLETMRLTRNHPALNARSWFEHMIYADELGSDVRAPGEFKKMIVESLSTRNFAFDSSFSAAKMTVTFNETELTQESSASREKPILVCGASAVTEFDLELRLTAGDSNFLSFPAIVKVEYQKGALQGAIKWEGEEKNPTIYRVESEGDLLKIPLKVSMKCETVNQPDGSCKDYAYLQVYKEGESKPRAKKRFYLNISENCSR